MNRSILLITGLVLFIYGCYTPQEAGFQNRSYLYKKEASVLHPEYFIFHNSDSTSELHFKLKSTELLYAKAADNNNFTARIRLTVTLFRNLGGIADTSTAVFTDEGRVSEDHFITGKLSFRAPAGSDYRVEATLHDLNRNNSFRSFLTADKTGPNARQYFMALEPATNTPLFKNYVSEGEKINITYSAKAADKLYVRFYSRDFPLPAPPFAPAAFKPFDYKSDSTFNISVENNMASFKAARKGFYHIQADTLADKEGFTIYVFEPGFPQVRTADDMIYPLRYITNKNEYEALTGAANKKLAVDEFWLKSAGNAERGKELIRKYYTRVEEANRLFTSFTEGWKTDRGLIFLIFGAPNIVYNNGSAETWIYGEEHNLMSLSFSFLKVRNPFTDNDYTLERSETLKSSWYRAVDTWRQGRVF